MALSENHYLKRWRANFFAGLAIVMPAVISVAVVVWIFQNVSNVTDKLLFFVPDKWIRPILPDGRLGDIPWYWSWFALLWTVFVVCLIGRYGRNYLGRKAFEWLDTAIMGVPLMNKIYSTVKQVNESFSSNKSSFKQVVLVTFPHGRSRAVGFVTGEQQGLGGEKLISVFVPTTPNPTSGFLMMVPESEIIKLDMSVADGIKFTISLGAISPGQAGHHLTPSLATMPPPAGRP
ncbi:MAG TPA: DUF502 domain-containing protein [Verrucomicrobiae bacterium]|jgi:uncharacterized membrane protein